MRRCESAVGGSGLTGTCPLENSGASNLSPTPLKRQGTDYLVEIDGKILSIYGQAMKHTLTVSNFSTYQTLATFSHILSLRHIYFSQKAFHKPLHQLHQANKPC